MGERKLPFLGTGWSFPPTFTRQGEELFVTTGVTNVHKSIQLILGTGLGERAMREDFGGALRRYQFEPLSARLLRDIEEVVSQAILRNEARVVLDQVDILQDRLGEGILMIRLQYTVRSNNSRFNMVYPFYLNEAEGINN